MQIPFPDQANANLVHLRFANICVTRVSVCDIYCLAICWCLFKGALHLCMSCCTLPFLFSLFHDPPNDMHDLFAFGTTSSLLTLKLKASSTYKKVSSLYLQELNLQVNGRRVCVCLYIYDCKTLCACDSWCFRVSSRSFRPPESFIHVPSC